MNRRARKLFAFAALTLGVAIAGYALVRRSGFDNQTAMRTNEVINLRPIVVTPKNAYPGINPEARYALRTDPQGLDQRGRNTGRI